LRWRRVRDGGGHVRALGRGAPASGREGVLPAEVEVEVEVVLRQDGRQVGALLAVGDAATGGVKEVDPARHNDVINEAAMATLFQKARFKLMHDTNYRNYVIKYLNTHRFHFNPPSIGVWIRGANVESETFNMFKLFKYFSMVSSSMENVDVLSHVTVLHLSSL